ncbi:hypothetical protein PVAG01_01203 [Phlyctema vagabunda]|uniref:Uncharacterized protein n=1 Tax=Phlyctema vagabunda TaxID=108571 RepID=A0ABR4PWF8_9HELO
MVPKQLRNQYQVPKMLSRRAPSAPKATGGAARRVLGRSGKVWKLGLGQTAQGHGDSVEVQACRKHESSRVDGILAAAHDGNVATGWLVA